MEARSGNPILRILKLWKVYAYLDLMWMTRDTRYFLICYISDVFMTVAAVGAMLLLAEKFDGIGHWTKYQVIFMLGYGSMLGGLMDSFFGYNVFTISRILGRGQLDHTLIQPQPVWTTLLTQGFSPFQNSARTLPGLALIVWSISRMDLPVSFAWLMLLLINVIASGVILISFNYLWGSLAFWAPHSAEEVNSSTTSLIYELKIFPLVGLSPAMTGMLLTVLPVGFIAWFPSQALVGIDARPWSAAITPAAAVVFAIITAGVFRKGLKYYGKTGSQRYYSRGHRC